MHCPSPLQTDPPEPRSSGCEICPRLPYADMVTVISSNSGTVMMVTPSIRGSTPARVAVEVILRRTQRQRSTSSTVLHPSEPRRTHRPASSLLPRAGTHSPPFTITLGVVQDEGTTVRLGKGYTKLMSSERIVSLFCPFSWNVVYNDCIINIRHAG